MKKFLSFAFALLLSIGVSAQTTLTEAVNFKSTAHNGEKIDLFEILDGDQYVLINFFAANDPECKEYAPRVVDAYYALGCNEGDVYFMEVSETDHGASYSAGGWISAYNIPYPTIHTKTKGDTGDSIAAWYKVSNKVPTFVLIAPDRKIVMQNCEPTSADDLVEKIISASDNKISENYCGKQVPEVTIEKIKKDNFVITDGVGVIYEASTKVFVKFRANAAVKSFYYIISESAQLTSEDIIAQGTETEEAEFEHTFDSLKESTTYYVYTQAVGYNDTVECAKTAIEVKTLCPGDDGDATVSLDVYVAEKVQATAVPNESVSDYHFGFVRKAYYDESARNRYVFLINLINDDYPFCDREVYEISSDSIPANTPYYVVAVGRNGEGEWFQPVMKEFVVSREAGPAEVTLKVDAKPNEVTITATPNEHAVEFHFGIVTKATFDADSANSIQLIRFDKYPAYEQTSATWVDGIVPGGEYVAIGSAKNSLNEWGETAIVHFTTPSEDALVEMEANFNIYPNPAQSMINIESSLNGKAQINIFDMTTRCVKQVSVSDMSNVSINVEDLNKGVYFISIQQNNSYSIQKLVIE